MDEKEKKERKVPKLRFPGFKEEWEERKLEDVATFAKGQGYSKNDLCDEGTPVILYGRLYTKYQTVIDEVDTFAKVKEDSMFSTGKEVVIPASGETAEDIARAAAIGKSGILLGGDLNIVYPDDNIEPAFLALSISNGKQKKILSTKAQGKSVVHLHNSDLKSVEIFYPQNVEQKKIIRCFRNLDNFMTIHQHKIEHLQELKKGLLQKMFPKECEKVPEIRLPGYTGDWEQHKFSDLVLIERGGSPRPIDAYITDAIDGLNWIKIGDAPAQGRYITKTAEKIKPEGLSKTRQVQPGDLILSNSMSFGKPYIMDIDGCIHDGWLLIRDIQGHFDLKFLCHMLGTDHMFGQYRKLAAGSTVNNLNKELVGNTIVALPTIKEQETIGEYLESFDHLITLHHRRLNHLKELKKSLLQQMLV